MTKDRPAAIGATGEPYAFDDESSPSKLGSNGTRRQFLGLATATSTALLAATAPTFAARSRASGLELPPASAAITPWKINIPDAALHDLKHRLGSARYPEKETVEDTSQGPQLGKFTSLMDYWRSKYDWRRCERMLNSFPQFRTELDGLGIHFIHVRSRHESALPMILTHGWPGSIVEFYKVIGPLVDPVAFGGDARDAFHVVIPSLPGFGFSDKPKVPGWNVACIARTWDALMKRLGYRRFVAQGGDWGAAVTTRLAEAKPEGLAGVHLNFPIFNPPPLEGDPTDEEKAAIARAKHYFDQLSGYSAIQKTRPQTIGYALTDSPIGQAAWIYDRFVTSTDSNNRPEDVLTKDEMLDDIMMYWLTGTAASSSRLYSESFKDFTTVKLEIPVGCTIFPGDVLQSPKVWAERTFSKLIYWNRAERGGHFAALEQPAIFVREVRDCFRSIRS
jgi:epoxide hydrolase